MDDVLRSFRGPVILNEGLLTLMNVGVKYKSADRKNFTVAQEEALGKYIDNVRGAVTDDVGVFLYGANSSGKTYVAAALCKEVWGQLGAPSYCVTASELRVCWTENKELKATTSVDCEETMAHRVKNVRFLVIDDMGKEYRTDKSKFFEGKLGELVRHRLKHGLTTSFTTNGDIETFRSVYGESLAELMKECMVPIKLSSENMREERSRRWGAYAD